MPQTSTTTRRGLALIVLAGALLLGVVACGSDSSAPATPVVACELMTSADVKAVYGIDAEGVEVPEDEDDPATGKCAYEIGAAGQIRLLARTVPDTATAEAQFADFRRQFQAYDEVDGLGDEALWVSETAQIMVRSGDTYFVITSPVGTPQGTAEDMARRVLAALDAKT